MACACIAGTSARLGSKYPGLAGPEPCSAAGTCSLEKLKMLSGLSRERKLVPGYTVPSASEIISRR